MSWMLLPGLDGTGKLFYPLLQTSPLEGEVKVVEYPEEGPQDYETLQRFVEAQLPNETFVLIAESFSGPIAARIAATRPKHLHAVVLIATFARNPVYEISWIPKPLIRKIVEWMPLSDLAVRAMLYGMDARQQDVTYAMEVIASVPSKVIAERVVQVLKLRGKLDPIACPVLYLRGKNDKLVGGNAYRAFEKACEKFHLETMETPHFLLQREPKETWKKIEAFLRTC